MVLFLRTTHDFLFYPEKFAYYVRKFWVLFVFILKQVVTLFKFWPTFLSYSSNGSLNFRGFIVVIWSAWFIWCCWSYHLSLLMLLREQNWILIPVAWVPQSIGWHGIPLPMPPGFPVFLGKERDLQTCSVKETSQVWQLVVTGCILLILPTRPNTSGQGGVSWVQLITVIGSFVLFSSGCY